MIDTLRPVLESPPAIAYALLFGSMARAQARAHSDVDVALGLLPGQRLTTMEIGALSRVLRAAVNCHRGA